MEGIGEINLRNVRKVYLITYARAHLNLFNTRQDFATKVITAINFQQSRSRLLHWVVCMEPHQGGGFHFHMAVCLSENKRWGPAKHALAALGINVNFHG